MTVLLVGIPAVGLAQPGTAAPPCEEAPDEAEITIPVSATGADEVSGPYLWLIEDYHYDAETDTVYREGNGIPGLQTSSEWCDSDGDGIADHRYSADDEVP